jgi:hypothetical protein
MTKLDDAFATRLSRSICDQILTLGTCLQIPFACVSQLLCQSYYQNTWWYLCFFVPAPKATRCTCIYVNGDKKNMHFTEI